MFRCLLQADVEIIERVIFWPHFEHLDQELFSSWHTIDTNRFIYYPYCLLVPDTFPSPDIAGSNATHAKAPTRSIDASLVTNARIENIFSPRAKSTNLQKYPNSSNMQWIEHANLCNNSDYVDVGKSLAIVFTNRQQANASKQPKQQRNA